MDRETIQHAGARLLAGYPSPEGSPIDLRVFAIVSDFDADRVYIVFRARVECDVADAGDFPVGAWLPHLTVELTQELKRGRHTVHTGSVCNGELLWTVPYQK
jgi:hypothetical protein